MSARPAGLAPRLACGLYELLLLAGVLLLCGFVLVPFGQVLQHDADSLRFYNRAWALLVSSLYFSWFWSHGGQTLPMKTWRLRLVRADGQPLGRAQALVRLALILAGCALGSLYAAGALAGLQFAWAFVDPDGLFLHDRLLGTRIVRV